MAVEWTEAQWQASYRRRVGRVERGNVWAPCTFVSGTVQAVNHGLTEGQYVIFRNVSATSGDGAPAEMATYRAINVTTDTFELGANPTLIPIPGVPDQSCEFSPTRLGENITYGREFYEAEDGSMPTFETRWSNLVRDLGIDPADRVLVGGAGFGFLIEAAKDAGFPNVWGIDNSPYIEANGPTETRGDITLIKDNFTGGGRVRAALRQATGDDEFDWVLTEDVLTSYTTQELPPYFSACETVLAAEAPTSQIVHMVTEAPLNPPFTELTLEQWQALEPTHTWVSIRLSQWRVL